MTPRADDPEVAALIVARAEAAGLRIAVAESLTGGLLADALVSIPGASAVFSGAVVAYDTELKHRLLGVDAELLRREGPVHSAVAEQMARGVRRACAVSRGGLVTPADVGVATTGVAGPAADPQTGLAAGTVWIALSSEVGETSVMLRLDGDRERVRRGAVGAALELLSRYLSQPDSSSAKTQE